MVRANVSIMIGKLIFRVRIARDWLHVRNLGHATLIAQLRLPSREFRAEGDALISKRWQLRVPSSLARPFLMGYQSLLRLEERYGSSFNLECSGDDLRVSFGGIITEARTWGDLDVLEEVFVNELYRFRTSGPVVAWDVGMNVGAASLFLASHPQVTAVFGSELFRPTFERAQRNFALNPALASKITAWCEGVADARATLHLPYAEELQGVLSIDGPLHPMEGATTRQEPVVIEAASLVMARIREQHPDACLLLKMDCEGAEARILRSLQTCGSLSEFSLIIMEWHGCAILAEVEQMLVEAGFTTTSMRFKGSEVGALSAYRHQAPSTS